MLVRKTVTVLFCDVVTSSAYGERLDPESWRRVMSRFFDAMQAVIERHGGTVEKFIGDEVMAVFGVPSVHEDDALRAVRAAAEMRDRLERLNDELDEIWGVRLQTRMGVNTGEVVAGDPATGSTFVTGDAVNLAKRLEQAADPGEILIGKATYPLVSNAVSAGPLESFSVKGKSQPVAPFRLERVDAGAAGLARRLDTPLVGRVRELAQLRAAFDAAVAGRDCRICTVLGTAGIGKSRLTGELLASLGEAATAVTGRCLPYGEGITFWPLRQIVNDVDLESVLAGAQDAEAVAARIRGTVGATEAPAAGAAEETFWAVRRFFESLAAPRPLVVCFEDIHWAEPTFLDLIEYLAGWLRGAPVLLLCLARPDLLEIRPSWATPRTNATLLALDPLSESESAELLDTLRGETELGGRARSQIAAAAEGNPLFVEQMLAMVADQEAIDEEMVVPPSIQALLAERLDRLGTDERAVIERASVIGREFPRGAVVELSPADRQGEVGSHLLALVRKELIEPNTSDYARQDGFRFRHSLIRDAAYEAIPKEVRAELHAQFADWMQRHTSGRATELEEIRGYHLEQAYRLREQLGPLDETTRDLATRAAQLLGSAGQRALARGDVPAAVSLIGRAIALLPAGDPGRFALMPDLGVALKESGELDRAETVLDETIAAARAAGDRRVESRALIERVALQFLKDPDERTDALLDPVEAAIPVLEQLGDDVALAKAWHLIALARGLWEGRVATGAEALERALDHARRGSDRRQKAVVLTQLAFAAASGPTPVPEAIHRCREILDAAEGDPTVEAGALRFLAELEARRCRFDEGRELIARARTIYDELGMTLTGIVLTTFALGRLELLAGDHTSAERELRAGYDALARMGERGFLSSVAGLLASALYAEKRYAEAEAFTRIAESAARSDDTWAQVIFRATRAKLLAMRGVSGAEPLAREAVALADRTDVLDLRGDALMDLAEVLERDGQAEAAVDAIHAAIELYDRKGNTAAALKARALLESAVTA